jgi:hypothetical protein
MFPALPIKPGYKSLLESDAFPNHFTKLTFLSFRRREQLATVDRSRKRHCYRQGYDLINRYILPSLFRHSHGYSLQNAAPNAKLIQKNYSALRLSWKRRTAVFYIIINASNPSRENARITPYATHFFHAIGVPFTLST